VASRGRVLVQVLGPLRVLDPGGSDITPTGALQRRLLALLVLRRGRVVSVDTATDTLWPTAAPRDPAGALHNHLSRLRQSLPAGAVESVGDGYRFDPASVDLDADRFAALLAASASDSVAAEIDAVLGRWDGPAYVELDGFDEARIESERLAELRLRGRERSAEHRLAIGATEGLVADLVALCDDEPLREHPRSLLIDALVATGRRADALRAYDDFRRRLGDELGIDPSPALVAQHATILAGPDPTAAGDWSRTTPLPLPATPLIGRERLEGEATALVSSSRLVSLVGPGGVGKTRLLLEIGHLLRAADPDRPVALCELSAADGTAVAAAVAGSLGVDLRPTVDPVDQVAGVVRDTEVVVLLDNCEHVLSPLAELVQRLLGRCERLRFVATSRERLRVPGEHVCQVPALATEGQDAPAVRLFVERARAVEAAFDPGPAELSVITDLVRCLDGLPLAIELAAARLLTHSLEEIVAGLDHRFSLLTSGPRTSDRHASLHAAVSWSFDLLDADLQQVLAAVSAFTGTFTASDAAAVCDLEPHEASSALAELTERSLVLRAPDRRYVLLETLRAFAAEQLVASGRRAEVAQRHAHHLTRWVAGADRRMLEPGTGAIAEIEAALPDLHLALGWLVDHEDATSAGGLVVALLDYGVLRLRPDVLVWADRVTACDPEDRSPVAPEVWVVAAYAAWMAGDLEECGARAARALAAADHARGDVSGLVGAIQGNHQLFQGRLVEAVEWYRRAGEAAQRTGDVAQWLFMASTELLALAYAGDPQATERAEALLAEAGGQDTPYAAYLWYCAGESDLEVDPVRARVRFVRALELADRTGASFVTGLAGASQASLEARLGDPEVAARDYRRLIDHWRRAGMWSTQWTMLRSIAALLGRLERHRDAAVLVGAVRSPGAGHRIFGADEAALDELGERLRDALGGTAYADALAEGAVLDGEAAVEHALRAL
jgi:predicted ATPase/DNA-binding winged helix-turn-helix (wHTH) protein